MPISADHVGRSYPPGEPYLVTAVKIAEFARALGDDNPAYAGRDAVAPPTFAIVLASWDAVLDDAELGLSLHRMVHADQKFTAQRPLRIGDQVVATTTIATVRNRGNVDFITLQTDVATTAGEQVTTLTSSLVHNRQEAADA